MALPPPDLDAAPPMSMRRLREVVVAVVATPDRRDQAEDLAARLAGHALPADRLDLAYLDLDGRPWEDTIETIERAAFDDEPRPRARLEVRTFDPGRETEVDAALVPEPAVVVGVIGPAAAEALRSRLADRAEPVSWWAASVDDDGLWTITDGTGRPNTILVRPGVTDRYLPLLLERDRLPVDGPWRATPAVEALIEDHLVAMKADGTPPMLRLAELRQHLHVRLPEIAIETADVVAALDRLERDGFMQRLPFGDWVVLRSSLIDDAEHELRSHLDTIRGPISLTALWESREAVSRLDPIGRDPASDFALRHAVILRALDHGRLRLEASAGRSDGVVRLAPGLGEMVDFEAENALRVHPERIAECRSVDVPVESVIRRLAVTLSRLDLDVELPSPDLLVLTLGGPSVLVSGTIDPDDGSSRFEIRWSATGHALDAAAHFALVAAEIGGRVDWRDPEMRQRCRTAAVLRTVRKHRRAARLRGRRDLGLLRFRAHVASIADEAGLQYVADTLDHAAMIADGSDDDPASRILLVSEHGPRVQRDEGDRFRFLPRGPGIVDPADAVLLVAADPTDRLYAMDVTRILRTGSRDWLEFAGEPCTAGMLWRVSRHPRTAPSTRRDTYLIEARGRYSIERGLGDRGEDRIRTFDLGGGVTMDFVWVPPGEFVQGAPESEKGSYRDERPQRRVQLARGFWLARTPVTQAQWSRVMGTTVQEQRDRADPGWALHGEGESHPMYYVNWHESVEFCARLGSLLAPQVSRGGSFRLPSESEWEYACRAGKSTRYHFGEETDLPQYAWYSANSERSTQPVGGRRPNNWGLYDMHGNVWEWCADVWHEDYEDAPRDGSPWMSGGDSSRRVLRGGSWNDIPGYLRAAYRDWDSPDLRGYIIGFRPALDSN